MRLLPVAALALLVSWQASAEPLNYAIYSLKGDKPELLAEDRLEYLVSDIDVVKRGQHLGHETWHKSLKLKEGFSIGALVVRVDKPEGFGLWIRQADHPRGFSWEAFQPYDGNVYKKLQGPGYVRVQFARSGDGIELQSIEFLADVKLRFMDDIKMT